MKTIADHTKITIAPGQDLYDGIRSHLGLEEVKQVKTALYKHKNADGHIIYVGVAKNIGARSAQHLNNSEWQTEIASIDVEWHDNSLMAELMEIKLIKSLRPKYNKAHNNNKPFDYAFHQRIDSFLKNEEKNINEKLKEYYQKLEDIAVTKDIVSTSKGKVREEMQEILEEEERDLCCMEGDPEIEDLLLEKHILMAHQDVVVNNLLNGEVLNDRDSQP